MDSPARTKLICPLTAGDVTSMRASMARAAEMGADAVECRLDFLAHPPGSDELRELLADPPAETIVTCRPTRQGGRYAGDEAARIDLLRQAGKLGADWIDLERDAAGGSGGGAGSVPSSRPACGAAPESRK